MGFAKSTRTPALFPAVGFFETKREDLIKKKQLSNVSLIQNPDLFGKGQIATLFPEPHYGLSFNLIPK